MDIESEIHPQLQLIAKRMPKLYFNRVTVKIIRYISKLLPKVSVPDSIVVRNVFIERSDTKNKLKLRVYYPKQLQSNVPGLLWIHGGGHVIGYPELNDSALIQFVQELGIVIVSVDYRLSPENPFPASINDCYTGLQWMVDHSDELGLDKNRISVGGESAGGGLAAALAQMAVDRKEIDLKFQLLVYPMLDDHSAIQEIYSGKKYFGWNQKNNYFGWKAYLNQEPGLDITPAYAVPARRKDLIGLPAAWIFCGSLDLFFDEDKLYAQRLTDSGVICEFESISGVFHGFDSATISNEFVTAFRKKQISVMKRYMF
jgi:acetyl esterase/lipase